MFESLAIGGISMTLPLLYCMFSPVVSFYKELRVDPSVLPSGPIAAQALIYSVHNGHLGDFPFFWMEIGITAESRYRINASNAINSQFEN